MKKTLNICKSYSGIRQDISDAEEMVIQDLILTEFKSLDQQEICKAFKMNASGKYWETIEAYQTFSPIFVGKVLTEYKEWKRKEAAKPKLIEPAKQLEAPKEDFSKHFDYVKREYKEKGILPPANWSGLYCWMEDKGMIKLSNDEKKKIYNQVKSEAELEITNRRSLLQSYADLLVNLNESNLKVASRKKAIENYLKDQSEHIQSCKYVKRVGESCTLNDNCKYPNCN